MKTCTRCGRRLQPEGFYRDRSKPDGLTSQCRECLKAARRRWYQENQERAKADARQRRTGSRQPRFGACDICGVEGPLTQDHDHRCHPTNRSCVRCRRGLLCQHCNLALGHMRDDPERMERAAAYLRSWSVEPGLLEPPAADAA